ncbi:ankyrin repeat-containing domain protein [Coprinopsis sp. MPI-PUGE-AT-0042]|nr:ankyrin repeat-containing domain protein [Coprinopsis sp. MPI-PUGE-AT-0042]
MSAHPSKASTPATIQQAYGVTTNHGDVNLAGRDVVHKHYHSYPDKVDITAVLGAIRNLRTIHLDIISKATPGTGVWLLKNQHFRIWLDSNGDLKILWGSGIPGAGKTVLASIVIRELEARAEAAGGKVCVCYVYIRYSDRADLTVRNVLEILVKQTVERHPECARLAEKAYARHLRETTQPTEADLLHLLRQFTEACAATFYVIDAMDEAQDRVQVDLVQKLASLNVRLFITSRPLKAVETRAPNAHCFPIVAQESDLDLHITQEIARSRDLANLLEKEGSSLRDEIVSLVKSKCGGMFLHASLQLDALCECVTAQEVRQTLEAFPSRIEDVYLQTWRQILEQRSSNAVLAMTTLVWVLNASRSMTIEELQHAVATSPETYKFEPSRLAPGTTLITLCRGLITLEEESKLVRLVHYTAKDTLQGLLRHSFPHPHSHLATVCMTHLTHCGFQNTTVHSEAEFVAVRQADPLLAYASDSWAVHARESLDAEDTRRLIAKFVSKCNAFPTYTTPKFSSFDVLGPLHIIAIHNLPMSLITQDDIADPNVVTQIYQRSPLMLASLSGYEGAVSSLIGHPEIQVNLVDSQGWSALMLAVQLGHEHLVRILLARLDILVNLVNNNGWSTLMAAAYNGHGGITRLLLARPEIQVNFVDNEGVSALMMAAHNGNEDVVKLLLSHPETRVSLIDNDGWSALMKAASKGHTGIVRLLLALPDIQVNQVHHEGWSALLLAASKGYEGIVKLLLACTNIQVNLTINDGWSALMLAAYYGYAGVVALLVAVEGIDVNAATRWGTAIILAAEGGHEAIIRLLLDVAGVDTTVKSAEDGHTAMSIAMAHEHSGVVRLLEEFESSKIGRGTRGSTVSHALQARAKRWKQVLTKPIRSLQLSSRRWGNATEGT